MKKLFLSLIVLFSFLIGNLSMVIAIVKLFGTDALIPVVKDLVHRRLEQLLWGDAIPRGRSTSLGQTAYGSMQTASRRQPLTTQQINVDDGPILKPAPGMPRRRTDDYGYGPRR